MVTKELTNNGSINLKTSSSIEAYQKTITKESRGVSERSYKNKEEKLINNTNLTIEEMYQQDPLQAVDETKVPPSVLYMLRNEPNEFINSFNIEK